MRDTLIYREITQIHKCGDMQMKIYWEKTSKPFYPLADKSLNIILKDNYICNEDTV